MADIDVRAQERDREINAVAEESAARFMAKLGGLCPECMSPEGLRPIYASETSNEIVAWAPCPVCR